MEYSKKIRFYLTISSVILTATILWYTIQNVPFPRPLVVFLGVGLSLTVLFGGLLSSSVPFRKEDTIFLTIYVFLVSFFIRVSGYLRVVYSGGDSYKLFHLAQQTIATGAYDAPGGLYGSAPLYIFEIVVTRLITGIGLSSTRFLMIFISSTFPLLLGILAYSITNNKKIAWFAALLGIVSPLNLRTSALLEPESIIFILLVVFLISMYATFSTANRRTHTVTILISVMMVLFHFFYALILWSVYSSVTISKLMLSKLRIIEHRDSKQVRLEVLASVIAGICISSYIIWSGFASTSVGMVASVFSVGIFDSILSVLLPSGGSASAKARSGGSTSYIILLGRYGPFLILGLLGAIGALESLRRRQHFTLHIIGGTLGILAIGIGVGLAGSPLSYQLRIYYYVTVILLLFAGIGIQYASSSLSWLKPVVHAVIVLLILGYVITAPLTPLANNVDPRFSETAFATTSSELETIESIKQLISPYRSVTVDQAPEENSRLYFLTKSSSGPPARITSERCAMNNTIWTNGNIGVCFD